MHSQGEYIEAAQLMDSLGNYKEAQDYLSAAEKYQFFLSNEDKYNECIYFHAKSYLKELMITMIHLYG